MTRVDPGTRHTTTSNEPMVPRRPGDAGTSQAVVAGTAAGLIAGLVFGVIAMIRSAAVGQGLLSPLEQIAAAFYGPQALGAGLGTALAGLAIHQLFAAVLGAMFGIFVGRRVPLAAALIFGLIYSVLIWAIMTYVILPATNTVMYNLQMAQPGSWFFYFLTFGAALALTPLLAARFGRRERYSPSSVGRARTGQY